MRNWCSTDRCDEGKKEAAWTGLVLAPVIFTKSQRRLEFGRYEAGAA